MSKLIDYIRANAVQCESGKGDADVIFFGVKKGDKATAYDFVEAFKDHKGDFNTVNPLDGEEHNYIELGGWIGDQGLALMFMGLGASLEVFDLLTPRTFNMPEHVVDQMAGMGMITIKKK